jgi:hypothetical protein
MLLPDAIIDEDGVEMGYIVPPVEWVRALELMHGLEDREVGEYWAKARARVTADLEGARPQLVLFPEVIAR